ncbi:MAG TPA: Rrf2 family transcriptional regulator [Aestuariivirgaceae bacterium]|nr:Rrf2 family transcriptional regulator [Aestuariivirgaceae bacterium]
MLGSSRFVIGIHVLAILARAHGREPVCSTFIAQSVNTNPVVIRRLMASMEQHYLVKSLAGRKGGFVLARQPKDITLQEIFAALEGSELFRMHAKEPSKECPVGASIAYVISKPLKLAEEAMNSALARTTLKDVVGEIPV